MLVHSIIPALVQVSHDVSVKCEIPVKQSDEFQGDPVEHFPAVSSLIRRDGEVFLTIFPYDIKPFFFPILDAHTSIGIDLEVEKVLLPFDLKEKLQAAVAAHGGQRL